MSVLGNLTPFTANYAVTFDRFSARASMNLKFDPESGEYVYGSNTKPKGVAALFGKIREWSVFKIDKNQITPLSFVHKSREQQNIDFDWVKNQAKSTTDGQSEVLDLDGDELDMMSLQMQLVLDLKNASLKNRYKVITDNVIKTYVIELEENEDLTLDGKILKTIKLKQQREGSSRHTYIWLAEELEYVLVQMHQYKGSELRGSLTLTGYKAEK